MAEIAFTAIKSNNYDRILEFTDAYYRKYRFRLVEERIGNRKGKFTTSPKSYSSLEEYEKLEIKPFREKELLYTTNFDFYVSLDNNPDWCIFSYPIRLAELTLNIDEDLTRFLSKKLNTVTIDNWEYTVTDMVIIRSFVNGVVRDLLSYFQGEIELGEMEGYFKNLKDFKIDHDQEEGIQEKLDERANFIDGFWKYIGFNYCYPNPFNEKNRRPLYLKGNPRDIEKFLQRKKNLFFIV